jgi:putative SOS response-associated peptidase YedK
LDRLSNETNNYSGEKRTIMCGRYTQHHTKEQVALRFDVAQIVTATTKRYNIAPAQPIPVIVENEGARWLDAFQWGLLPSWVKDIKTAKGLINARAETVAEKPSFRSALSKRRCIIPSDGFFEWVRQGDTKQPMHIRRKDGELYGFAGLWEEWKGEDDVVLRTCTIITTEANELVKTIHDRMPVILRPEDEEAWLDVKANSAADVLPLLLPYPAEVMEAFPVSSRVNKPTQDVPELLNSL